MRKASFIWPWEKSVKKLLVSSLQNTHHSFCVKQNYLRVVFDNPLFIAMEGKSSSNKIGLMPSIVINTFLNAFYKISSYWRAVWTSLQFISMSIMSLNQSIGQSYFFTSFKNKIHSPLYQIREQTFENQVSKVIVFTLDVNMGSREAVAKCD